MTELPSPPPSPALPRPFGSRYVLLKELGEGGMGQVYMAVNAQAGAERVLALKVLKDIQGGRDSEDLGQRFLDETKVVTKLSHENLVFVFDFGLAKRQGYLAMEYVRGKTLTEVWNRCAKLAVPFPLGVSLWLVAELTGGLGYAHHLPGVKLVHRDVSPSNVMLAYTGGLKLIDFGLAKWKSKVAQTATGINWGKLGYMSPEQYSGKPIDYRSDLFSAGVILWELLTGRQLFPNEQARARSVQVPPPSTVNGYVSADLDLLVQKAVATSPDDRFQSGEKMSAALAALMPRDAGKLRMAGFMRELFEADAKAESAEEDRLLKHASSFHGTMTPDALAASAPPDPLVGAILADRYKIHRLVGEGAMGRVYEGQHTGVGKRVAIKIPRHSQANQADLLRRFRMEANAASQIGHPHIADVIDCGTTPGGDFFFVMEFIEGVDLGQLAARHGPLATARCLRIAIQICRALEAAHKAGIIHRDLKPSNVMLVREGNEDDFVKVLDFGVAKFLKTDALPSAPDTATPSPPRDPTRAHMAIGTPRYMAPEQMGAGAATVDFRADIYALGGLLYFLLSGGHVPFEDDTIEALWHNKSHNDAPPLRTHRKDLPAFLESLVASCLARDPAQRPRTMDILRRDLALVIDRLGDRSGDPPAGRERSSTVPLHRFGAGGGRRIGFGVAGIVVALGGAAWAWRWHEQPRRETAPAPAPIAPVARPIVTVKPPIAPPVPAAAPAPAAARTPTPPARIPIAAARYPSARITAPTVRATPSSPTAITIRSANGEIHALLDTAESALQNGQFVKALMTARKTLGRLPSGTVATTADHLRAYLILGRTYHRMAQYEEALAAYDEAARVGPDNAEAAQGRERARTALLAR